MCCVMSAIINSCVNRCPSPKCNGICLVLYVLMPLPFADPKVSPSHGNIFIVDTRKKKCSIGLPYHFGKLGIRRFRKWICYNRNRVPFLSNSLRESLHENHTAISDTSNQHNYLKIYQLTERKLN